MNENIDLNGESVDDKRSREFQEFVIENDFSGEDLTKAYYLLCGVSEMDDSVEENVRILYTKMKELEELGYPINRFIEFANEWTNAIDSFEKKVAELNVSDNEKRMLNSIISEKRFGEVQVHLDGDIFMSFKIKEHESSKELALALDNVLFSRLSDMPEGEVSIWFEESV